MPLGVPLLVCICIAAVSSSASQSRCCTPREWEGEAFVYDKPKNFTAFEFISYDFNHERARVDVFVDELSVNKTFFMTQWFFGRREQGVEVFTYTKEKGCVKEARTAPFREICVRDNHRENIDVTIGGILRAKLYRFSREQFQSDQLVAEHDCVPISGAFFDHHATTYSFDADVRYYNIRHGIGNPVVWELPAACRTL